MHTRMFPPAPPEGYAEKCYPAVKTSERKRLPLFYEFPKEQKLRNAKILFPFPSVPLTTLYQLPGLPI